MLIRKTNSAWAPAENTNLKVGETIEISDYITIVRQGLGVLVDEAGNELPLPGSTLTCPVCYKIIPGTLAEFTAHVASAHSAPTQKETVAEPVKEEAVTPAVAMTTNQKIAAALAKARAAKVAKAAGGVA